MAESLKQKAISGTKWKTSLNAGRYFISFFLSIILARLLEPREFGLIGMISILMAVAQIFIDSGLSQAVIRQKNVTEDDYSTVFYFNIFISSCFYLLFFFTAPLVADFFNEPILIPITRLVTLVFLINSSGIIQNSILVREVKFKIQAICNYTGLIVSVVIASIMAFNGYGVYSIVAQAISQALVTNIMFWITSDWRPKGGFSKDSFKRLWAFASNILATNIIVRIVQNIDNVLIAKVFSAQQLGFYIKAKSSNEASQTVFTDTFSAISFAILVKGNQNESEFKRFHMLFFNVGAYVYLPVVFGFIAIAKAFTIVLFTNKWLPSVQLTQIIAFSSIAYFFAALFSQTMLVKGEGKLYFRLSSGKKLLTLLAIPFGVFWGLYPFVWSFVAIGFFGLLMDFYFVGKLVENNVFIYLKLLIKPLLIASFMGFLVFLLTFLPINNYYILLFFQLTTGFVIYILLSIIFKIKEYYYVKEIFKEQMIKYPKIYNVFKNI